MTASKAHRSPLSGVVEEVSVKNGQFVDQGDLLLILESMKVHVRIEAETSGTVNELNLKKADAVNRNDVLLVLIDPQNSDQPTPTQGSQRTESLPHPAIETWKQRQALSLDPARSKEVQKRHTKDYATARENLANLCDTDGFQEYGQLAVAAQRQRQDYETLKTTTAADGVITGVAAVDGISTALIINDYSVLAGTQGYFHHQKIDRMLDVAGKQSLPVIMFTEGGGGRPGDTDVTTINSGLQCTTFATWAGLSGQVPRITIANGYNFAGNAALFGAGDITIATKRAWIGMAGPAMIAGGGLGTFKATDIGPIDTQSTNGVVDIVAEDEADACRLARKTLSLVTKKSIESWRAPAQDLLQSVMPESRRVTYDVRSILSTIADLDSLVELQADYGKSIITMFMRIEGRSIGVLANDCRHLGGAIDTDAGQKASRFMQLCNDFKLPIVSFCDTPGFMVGPEHEEQAAVRRLAELFKVGAQLTVPFYAVVLRKCYGLGAQAMLGGSTKAPLYTLAWPTGEFGPMGLEGAVTLGFKKELEAQPCEESRNELFDKLLDEQYSKGQAIEVASVLELDAVIAPTDTRSTLSRVLKRQSNH